MRLRKAADGPVQVAAEYWGNGCPVSAMRVLRDAGYDAAARADFLRKVVGLAVDAAEFTADRYIPDDDVLSDDDEPPDVRERDVRVVPRVVVRLRAGDRVRDVVHGRTGTVLATYSSGAIARVRWDWKRRPCPVTDIGAVQLTRAPDTPHRV